MGGLAVVFGFALGFFILMSFSMHAYSLELIAGIIAIFGAAYVGILDDLIVLRQRLKALLPFMFVLPLALLLKDSMIVIPFAGAVNIGFFMLILIPLAVTSAANVSNMLEGFNGLGAGIGFINCTVLGMIAFVSADTISLIILIPMAGALLAFLMYNRYPARIFGGDTLTLFIGAAIATAAILGDLEFIGTILFAPLMFEFVLKARGRFRTGDWPESFGRLDKNGRLYHKGPIGSITHFFMKSCSRTERELVRDIWLMQIFFGAAVIALYLISFNAFGN
jgi:UDP-N-acetylglucosamine--dolichyl-phosphate N-acetylglucosaminephosphotransferase